MNFYGWYQPPTQLETTLIKAGEVGFKIMLLATVAVIVWWFLKKGFGKGW